MIYIIHINLIFNWIRSKNQRVIKTQKRFPHRTFENTIETRGDRLPEAHPWIRIFYLCAFVFSHTLYSIHPCSTWKLRSPTNFQQAFGGTPHLPDGTLYLYLPVCQPKSETIWNGRKKVGAESKQGQKLERAAGKRPSGSTPNAAPIFFPSAPTSGKRNASELAVSYVFRCLSEKLGI